MSTSPLEIRRTHAPVVSQSREEERCPSVNKYKVVSKANQEQPYIFGGDSSDVARNPLRDCGLGKETTKMHPNFGLCPIFYMMPKKGVGTVCPPLTTITASGSLLENEFLTDSSRLSPPLMARRDELANSSFPVKRDKDCPGFSKNDNEDSIITSSESMSDSLSADRDEFSFSDCMSSYNEGTVSDLTEELFDKPKADELDERRSNDDMEDFVDEEVRTITNFDLADDSLPSGDSDRLKTDFADIDGVSPISQNIGDNERDAHLTHDLSVRPDSSEAGTAIRSRSCLIDYRSYKRTPFARVTFADARGYELEKIRYLTPPNDYLPPMMLRDSLNSKFELLFRQTKPRRNLIPLFDQPNARPSFLNDVMRSTVMLEYAFSNCLSLYGSVRIKNIEFEKNIHIRYTIDDWKTVRELRATYSHHHDDSDTDSFSFYYNFSIWATRLRRIEFAVQYKSTKGEEFWDNNEGRNYALLYDCS